MSEQAPTITQPQQDSSILESSSPLSLFWEGYRAAMPLMVGVAPFGIVFGALAISAGMSPIQALGMSIFVIAGSSQFVAAQLIHDQTPIAIIVFTTFIINLRHFLYSASLATYLRPLSAGWKMLLAYIMIDEVYAPTMQRKQKGNLSPFELRWYFLGAGICLATVWWITTVIGAFVGNQLSADMTEKLGFTLPLVFTSIIVPSLVPRPALYAALSAGVAGIIFAPLPNNLGLMVAAGIGLLVGVLTERYEDKK